MNLLQKTLRVLVVDDDADHAASLASLLGEYGYDAHVCLGAQDCLAAVDQLRPHVILLDLAMPGMTGFAVADEIRRRTDSCPALLVAVTGHGQDLDRVQSKLHGFAHHLLKPIDFQELEAIVNSMDVQAE